MTTAERISASEGKAQLFEAKAIERMVRAYQASPARYLKQVYKMRLTPDQEEFCGIVAKNRRIHGQACHAVGKTVICAGITNYHFDLFKPSKTLTTAPSAAQVDEVLWSNIRLQRERLGFDDVMQPKAPRMSTAPDHFAVGYTSRDSDAAQGRHEDRMLILMEEAVGIKAPFHLSTEGMSTGDNNKICKIYNPTDSTSAIYNESTRGQYVVFQFTSFDWRDMERSHPNILAGLRGEEVPFPGAITVGWIDDRCKDEEWCEPVSYADRREETDFEWRGQWYRPGGFFESRVLGRWPTQSISAVWSDARWKHALIQQPEDDAPTQIGCDVARFGDDNTSMFVRRGITAKHHETHNGWDTERTADYLMDMAGSHKSEGEDIREVLLVVDDDGVGGGVVDKLRKKKFKVRPVNSASRARVPSDYPNMRSEIWFAVSATAGDGRMDLSRLSSRSKDLLRAQLLGVKYGYDSQGRRVVESKDITKKADRLGRSPDDADALNLAYSSPKELELTFF